jgi:plastocyanin
MNEEPTEPTEPTGPRLPPVAYPLLAAAFVAVLVWSFSRILLAVSTLRLHMAGIDISGKAATAVIALLVAVNVLVGSALVAYGRRVRKRPASFPLLLAAGALMVAGGVAALSVKQPPAEAKAQVVPLTAEGVKFLQPSLTLHAGGQVTIAFDNKDAGIQHNFHLFNGADAAAPSLYPGALVTGPAMTKYTFPAPPPGMYFFHCDVHPAQMSGTATVTAGPAAPPGVIDETAKGISFTEPKLSAPEGGQITIHFDNQDAGVPHNIVVFNGADGSAPMLFTGPPVTGPGAVDYTFSAPPPGMYFFHCVFHPAQMTGTLTVGPPGGGPSPKPSATPSASPG